MADDGEVTFDDSEIQRILNSAPLVAELKRIGAVIMSTARANSPVRTGKYLNSFRLEVVPNKNLRTIVFVVNDDPKAMVIESVHGVLNKSKKAR